MTELVLFAESSGDAAVWLLIALIAGTLPSHDDVRDYRRRAALTDPVTALVGSSGLTHFDRRRKITVINQNVLLRKPESTSIGSPLAASQVDDVAINLSRFGTATEVRWTSDKRRWLQGKQTVVPWHAHIVVADMDTRASPALRLAAISDFSQSTTVGVGYGLDDLAGDPETAPGLATYLTSLQWLDRVLAVDEKAERQYAGWTAMLRSTGLRVPSVSRLIPPRGSDAAAWRNYLAAVFATSKSP